MISTRRFGWHAKSYDPRMASIRLRLLQPVEYLRAHGVDAAPYDDAIGPLGYDAIIFSKSFGKKALEIARTAKTAGKVVILDLCDNIFEGKQNWKRAGKVERLTTMLALADHVVFATSTLAAQIQKAVPDFPGQRHVIADAIESIADTQAYPLSIGDRLGLAGLKRFLGRHDRALHCVWFGKSQGKKSGLVHLDDAIAELELFARHHPVTLTIISNKRMQYWRAAAKWRVPCHYMSWSLASINPALALHDVAIVPLKKNSYTVGKTINRPATAIAAGLGVIADSIDSYEELRPFIVLDDWQGGLERYSLCKPKDDPALPAAQAHLEERYGFEKMGKAWRALLEEATAKPA